MEHYMIRKHHSLGGVTEFPSITIFNLMHEGVIFDLKHLWNIR